MKTILQLVRSPIEIIRLLQSIDDRLKNIEETSNKLSRTIDDSNHRGRMSVRTGHWND